MLLKRPYLRPSCFIIRTNHEALKDFLITALASDTLTRCWLRLLKFGFEIDHRVGIKHEAPDTLLRLKTEGTDKTNLDKELMVLIIRRTVEHHDVEAAYFDQD